jgi:hypothetical protein
MAWTFPQDVKTYEVSLSHYPNIYTGKYPITSIKLVPPPDFHGGVHTAILSFSPAFSGSNIGHMSGPDPFTYNLYVNSPEIDLATKMLCVLERPGPKHMSFWLDGDFPADGPVSIPIIGFGISTETVSVQIAHLREQQLLPEELRSLFPAVQLPGFNHG